MFKTPPRLPGFQMRRKSSPTMDTRPEVVHWRSGSLPDTSGCLWSCPATYLESLVCRTCPWLAWAAKATISWSHLLAPLRAGPGGWGWNCSCTVSIFFLFLYYSFQSLGTSLRSASMSLRPAHIASLPRRPAINSSHPVSSHYYDLRQLEPEEDLIDFNSRPPTPQKQADHFDTPGYRSGRNPFGRDHGSKRCQAK